MSDHERHDGDCDDRGEQFVADCRVRLAADLFAHTWNPVVLTALRAGPRRRRTLRAEIGGISDKVLTDTLRRLERSGLITRTAYAEAPPRVDYALTPLGRSLVDGPIAALGRWSLDHGEQLAAAQEPIDDPPLSSPQPAQQRADAPPLHSQQPAQQRADDPPLISRRSA